MEYRAVSPRLPVDPDSDVTSEASFGARDGDSEYVKSTGNLPMILNIAPYLTEHTSKLEMMHKVSEGETDASF